MISVALGLFILAGLVGLFANSSQAHREFQRTSLQIENGRYAVDFITHDIHHAGYYGQFFKVTAAAAPDPCAVSDAGGALTAALGYPLQGFDAPDWATRPDLSTTTCGAWLPAANLVPGSDVAVVRRAETVALAPTAVPVPNDVYIQANPVAAEIQFGAGGPIGTTNKANGLSATIKARDGVSAAPIRKLRVHVYFVAPCSVPAGGGEICTGAADDRGRPIPTLKRLELGAAGGATTMTIAPIAEGIESLQIDFGIDDSPGVEDPMTGLKGDGSPDRYVRAPTAAESQNIVSARVHILSRNPEPTPGHNDAKTYSLGIAGAVGPFADAFKRHVYAGAVRANNPSARREIPR
jgi:type IV pilus assembly protein PilW